MCEFLFKDDPKFEEISYVLNNSTPKFVTKLDCNKIESDFDIGYFAFYFKNKKEFKIPFYKKDYQSINDFWRFLEFSTKTKSAILFSVFYNGEEFFIYLNPVDKFFRFTFLDTTEASKKQKEGKILRYSYKESEIKLDILINKKKFIKQFYQILFNLFKNYEPLAFFEPPFIDFDFWIKDSKILKDYIK